MNFDIICFLAICYILGGLSFAGTIGLYFDSDSVLVRCLAVLLWPATLPVAIALYYRDKNKS